MDLDEAITVHAEWKHAFRTAIAKHEQMDEASIASDSCCRLGRWLQDEGERLYGSLPSYPVVVLDHAAFHQEAGKVATLINTGHFEAAKAQLEYGSSYFRAAQAMAISIMSLKIEIIK